jgi:hypothetical protein
MTNATNHTEDQKNGNPQAGMRAPDGRVLPFTPLEPVRLFTLLRDKRHTLLLFLGTNPTPDDRKQLAAVAQIMREQYARQVRRWFVFRQAAAVPSALAPEEVLVDLEGTLHQQYGADASIYLIRPDGYIGFRGVPARADHFLQYVRQLFGEPRA